MNGALLVEHEKPGVAAGGLQHFGALPWRNDRDGRTRLLLVTARGHERWTVPMGRPAEDQPPFVTASRRAFEQAGIIGDIYPQPIADYPDDGTGGPCRITVYSLKVYGTLSNWREQERFRRRWFSVEEAADRLADAGLAEFVRLNGAFLDALMPEGRAPLRPVLRNAGR